MSGDSSKATVAKHAEAVLKPTSKNGVTWGPVSALVLVLATYVLAGIGGSLIMLLYPHLQGWSQARTDAWLGATGAQFAYVLISQGITLGAVALFLRFRSASPRALGLVRPQWLDPLFAMLGVAVYFILYVVVVLGLQATVGIDIGQEQDIGFEHVAGVGALLMTFVSLVIVPPLVEEIVFRGFVYGGLRRYLPVGVSIVSTSLFFAFFHLLGSSDGKLLWIAGVDTLVLSIVLCFLREKTGRLWAGIGVHALKNGVAFLTLFILQGR